MRSPQRLGIAGLALISACGLACSGSTGEAEEVGAARSELVVNQANVFGFEDATQWKSSVTLSSSTTHTQGSKSLGVKAKGYTEVTSVALPSLTGVTGRIGFDLLLPTAEPNPFWYGFVQLLVSVPSKGVNNLFVGQQELTGKPLNQFFPVDFILPPSLVTTLQAGGYSDFKAKLVVNVPSNATGTYLFDNLHFLAGAVGANDLVETDVLSRWSWGSQIPTDTCTLSVLGAGQAHLGQAALRAVTDAGFDFWLRYTAPTPIDIGTDDSLRFAIRALNTNSGWQQGPVVIIEDSTGARLRLDPSSTDLPADGTTWADYRVPLAGGLGWTSSGNADLHKVSAIELHTDTWEGGYTLDLDAVRFTGMFEACAGTPPSITPTATARATTATVTYPAVPGAIGYDIYRMPSGGVASFVNRARGTLFEDSGLSLGTTYRYEVRAVMPGGCESGSGTTTVTTAASATGLSRIPTLNVLVPIYINSVSNYTPSEIAEVKAGLELGRQFYFRNSTGRLDLAFDYMEVNAATPDTAGPTMDNISIDLSGRGIADNQYDAVFPVAKDLNGCWGGFVLLGRTVGAFGTACGVPYPANVSGTTQDMAWNFTHEFQHAFDTLADLSGANLISGHPDSVYGDQPYSGPVIDAGEHYDWEGATLRMFTAYTALAAPFNDYLEVQDPDGDGLASSDARLPIDEARFGSRADLADTDADGLNDLAEYAAGRFASSNPVVADTDGDGQRDGVDPTPRQAIAASITAATPTIDGVRDAGYTLFRNGIEFTNVAGFTAATYFAYDANAVYVYLEESQNADLYLIIDGSGQNGFWAGDDSYAFTLNTTEGLLNWTSRHGGLPAGVAVTGSQFKSRTVGTTTIMEAKIPRTGLGQGFGYTGGTTNGFSTAVGSVLGLRITFTNFGTGERFNPPWATQNEYYHFDDVTLR
jgi:hypothetical protein